MKLSEKWSNCSPATSSAYKNRISETILVINSRKQPRVRSVGEIDARLDPIPLSFRPSTQCSLRSTLNRHQGSR